jgi:hypothetical protein
MRRLASLLLSSALALFGTTLIAQPPSVPQFSADMTMKLAKKGGQTVPGKFYFGNKKMRMDMSMEGHDISNITDLEAKKGYMVMNQQHMYMEHDLGQMAGGPMGRMPQIDPIKDPNHPCDPDHFTCNKVGSEMVNGRMTDKWEYKAKDEGNEVENQTVWVDQKMHFPIRTITGDGTEMNMTNIKEGPQDASLFQPPAGYQKMGGFGMGQMGRRPH